jgi:hypothetical protein
VLPGAQAQVDWGDEGDLPADVGIARSFVPYDLVVFPESVCCLTTGMDLARSGTLTVARRRHVAPGVTVPLHAEAATFLSTTASSSMCWPPTRPPARTGWGSITSPLSGSQSCKFALVGPEGLKDGIEKAAPRVCGVPRGRCRSYFGGAESWPGRWMPVSLGERDSVQCGIGLPVSGAAKSVSGLVRRPDRQWCGAVVAGVGVAGLEPIDAGGLADDLGGSKRPTAPAGRGEPAPPARRVE